MNVNIELAGVLFIFRDMADWRDHASQLYQDSGIPLELTIAVDAGRPCPMGRHFMRAAEEATFPVTVYEIPR